MAAPLLPLADRVLAGDVRAIARAISLIEDESPGGAALVRAVFPNTGRAFLVGLGITLIGTACYVATWQLVKDRMAPDYTEKYAAYALEKAQASGASAAEIAEKSKEMAEFRVLYEKPLASIAFTFLEPLPVGLLFTLVGAWALSRKRRPAGVPEPA